VLAGTVPTASGFGRLRAVEPTVAVSALASVIGAVNAAGAPVVVHCCAPDVPFALLRDAGAAGIAVDPGVLRSAILNPPAATGTGTPSADAASAGSSATAAASRTVDDEIAATIEAGVGLLLGLVPSTEPAGRAPSASRLAERALALRQLGFSGRLVADRVTVTPGCGLANASARWSRAALRLARETARALADVED
jgi:hypothetical protein